MRDPKDFFGDPLLAGEYGGDAVNVPVPGEFGAFIVVVKPEGRCLRTIMFRGGVPE